jgi:hypothetical protein
LSWRTRGWTNSPPVSRNGGRPGPLDQHARDASTPLPGTQQSDAMTVARSGFRTKTVYRAGYGQTRHGFRNPLPAPSPPPTRAGKGIDVATRSPYPTPTDPGSPTDSGSPTEPGSPPDPPTTPATADERGVLDVGTTRGRVPSVSRPSSRTPDWRMRQAKAQPLELRLRKLFCSCLFLRKFGTEAHRCTPQLGNATHAICFMIWVATC